MQPTVTEPLRFNLGLFVSREPRNVPLCFCKPTVGGDYIWQSTATESWGGVSLWSGINLTAPSVSVPGNFFQFTALHSYLWIFTPWSVSLIGSERLSWSSSGLECPRALNPACSHRFAVTSSDNQASRFQLPWDSLRSDHQRVIATSDRSSGRG